MCNVLQNKRQLMAIVYETLKYSDVLQQILTSTNLQSLEKCLKDVHLTKILMYDALIGNGIEGNGKQEVSCLFILYYFFLFGLFILDYSIYC